MKIARTGKYANRHTRETIISSAKEVFAERGFEPASMSRIAEKARIDKSSLYYFFRDKEDLFSAVTSDIWRELSQKVIESLGKGSSKNGRQVLSRACQAFITSWQKAGLAMAKMELPAMNGPTFKQIMSEIKSMRSKTIEFLKNCGVNEPEVAHCLISNAIYAYVIHCRTGKPQPPAKKYCDYLSSLLISKKFD